MQEERIERKYDKFLIRAAIFGRVSMDKQTMGNQTNELLSVVAYNGWDVVAVYSNVISGFLEDATTTDLNSRLLLLAFLCADINKPRVVSLIHEKD